MPSPIGHSLLGLAVGVGFYMPRGRWADLGSGFRSCAPKLAAAVFLANAPDLDYLPGILHGDLNAYHHGYTHTLGWVLLVTAGWWLVWKALDRGLGFRAALFAFVALSSHLAADWVADDGRPPFGIMAFWPVSGDYFMCPLHLFWRLYKKDYGEFLQWHNAGALAFEVAWCLPVVLLALVIKSPGGRRAAARHPPGAGPNNY